MTSPADPDAPIEDPVWLAADRELGALVDAAVLFHDWEYFYYFDLAMIIADYMDLIKLEECEPEDQLDSSSSPPIEPDPVEAKRCVKRALVALAEAADLSIDLTDRLFFGWAIHEVNSFRPLNGL